MGVQEQAPVAAGFRSCSIVVSFSLQLAGWGWSWGGVGRPRSNTCRQTYAGEIPLNGRKVQTNCLRDVLSMCRPRHCTQQSLPKDSSRSIRDLSRVPREVRGVSLSLPSDPRRLRRLRPRKGRYTKGHHASPQDQLSSEEREQASKGTTTAMPSSRSVKAAKRVSHATLPKEGGLQKGDQGRQASYSRYDRWTRPSRKRAWGSRGKKVECKAK